MNSKGLVTNYGGGGGGGGYTTGGEVLPYKKGGWKKIAMLKEGGGTKSFGVVFYAVA